MQIKYSNETAEGEVTFQGTLEGPELTIVLETGLNELMRRGLVPFQSLESVNPADLHDVPEYDQ